MVLGGHRHPRPRPEAALDLEVPRAPAAVHDGEVLAGCHLLPGALEDRLLLEAVLRPEGEGERAVPPRDWQGASPVAVDGLGLGEAARPPAVALETAQERSEVRQD